MYIRDRTYVVHHVLHKKEAAPQTEDEESEKRAADTDNPGGCNLVVVVVGLFPMSSVVTTDLYRL
jgi:hypothetical protein